MQDDNQIQDQKQEETKVTEEPKEPEAVAETPDEAQSSTDEQEPELAPPAPAVMEPELAPPAPAVVEESDKETKKPEESEESGTGQTTEAPVPTPEPSTDTAPTDHLTPGPVPSPTIPSGPKARWYVVHTYSGHEAKVAATLKQRVASQKLEDKVLDIMVPTQDKIEIREGKKAKIKEKIFPGYLLIKMVLDDNTWLIVRTTPGITSFVGMGNRPTPLPDEEVNTIQKYMTMEAPKFKASFSVGEAVKITDGPFSEFLGSISEIDEARGKMKVLVSIFGRETPVELDFLQVAKL